MKFGVFDHMDVSSAVPLAQQYEERLKLIEAYDRSGFFCYHLAEHHSTPLGMAPSPAVFLSAVAQRSKQMRLGPLVYILTLQNPLRAYEDICMLDQLSGGRIELGLGRGVSPIEIEYYGVDPNESRSIYSEATQIVMKAFTSDTLNFEGKHFRYVDSPVAIKPFQKPHPPLWQGIGAQESIPSAVKNKINMVCNGSSVQVRALTDVYRDQWSKAWSGTPPIIGMNRHIVVADTEAEAVKLAKSAYLAWYESFIMLWKKKNVQAPLATYSPDYQESVNRGFILAGTAQQVGEMIEKQVADCGINYMMCRLAFGNLPYEASLRSIELLASEIMPKIRKAA